MKKITIKKKLPKAQNGAFMASITGSAKEADERAKAQQSASQYNAVMEGVGKVPVIGGVIKGVTAVGDAIGEPIKEKSERVDSRGFINTKKASTNAAIGGAFNPLKVMTNKDVSTGDKLGTFVPGLNLLTGASGRYADKLRKRARTQYLTGLEEKGKDLITSGNNTQGTVMRKGTKKVLLPNLEVERDEIVAKKINGKYKVKADFKGGPTHEEGGIQYSADKGDVVFPKKDRQKVVAALKTKDNNKLDMIKNKLPEMSLKGKPKAKFGAVVKDVFGKAKGYANKEDAAGRTNISKALDYTSSIATLGKSLKKPETVSRNFLSPDKIEYKDRSSKVRQDVMDASKIESSNIDRMTGGNAGVALANKRASVANKMKAMTSINVAEVSRADQIKARNVGEKSRVKAINLELVNKYNELDAQNRAASGAYQDQAISDMNRIRNQQITDELNAKRDKRMLEMVKSNNPNVVVDDSGKLTTKGKAAKYSKIPKMPDISIKAKKRKDFSK